MTKRELVIRIAEESKREEATELSQQQVFFVVQKTLDYITESLANGENIEFRDFGVFEIKTRKRRIGRNPNKPENTVVIPERRVVKFKPGKEMKARVLKSQT
ncbi:MAG: HU family DNA-binding protein [bacterium]